MKRLLVTIGVLVCGTVFVATALADDADDAIAATLKHFEAWTAGDAATYVQHHLAENSIFTPGGGLLVENNSLEKERKDLQAQFDAGVKPDLELRHLKAKIYGNTAVVTGYVVGTFTSADGSTQPVMSRRTAVLVKQGGEWREAHTHTSPVRTPE